MLFHSNIHRQISVSKGGWVGGGASSGPKIVELLILNEGIFLIFLQDWGIPAEKNKNKINK